MNTSFMKMKLKRPLENGTMFRSVGINSEQLIAIVDALRSYAKKNCIDEDKSFSSLLGISGMLADACDGRSELTGWVFGYSHGEAFSEHSKPMIHANPNYPIELGPEAYGIEKWCDVDDWFEFVEA